MPESEASPFRQAIERICGGSSEAVDQFIEDYGPHIQRVVRSRLNPSLRAKFDSLDFVQMVWMTLFSDLSKLAEFTDPDELTAYLVVLARNKVIEETRRRTRYQKYNIRRESDLNVSDPQVQASVRRNDTPSAQLIARERFDKILNEKSDRDRRVFALRMEGATFNEIAAQLGISERTARQVMVDIEQACHTEAADDPPKAP
jgi:RNA polymerase sigma factor (sigma-70 family)